MLTTKTKIGIARVLSASIIFARKIVGLKETTRVTRGGLAWDLDLNEGIDLAIYLNTYQVIEQRIRALLKPGMVVVDIGANVGAFTLPLAKCVGPSGRVIAVEATAFAFKKLTANLAINPEVMQTIVPVHAVLMGADDKAAPDQIYSSWRLDNTDGNDRHPEHLGVGMSTKGALPISLDGLLKADARLSGLASRIGFIKLDVDGNERDVLAGARLTIAATKPFILLELAPYVQDEKAGGLAALLAELDSLGYQIENAATGEMIETSVASVTRVIPHGAGIDVLCRAKASSA